MNVARYQLLARRAVAEIQRRGRLPLLVGGTGLYVRAVIQDYRFGRAEPDASLRRALKQRAEAEGSAALHRELAAVDPASAAEIHPHDLRRIVRALEYHTVTGQPLAEARAGSGRLLYDHVTFILTRDREALYARIDRRCRAMLAAGLLAEVRGLLAQGLDEEVRPLQALGYRHVLTHLRGDATLAEALASFQRDTRRFAKRQLTWFRGEEAACWLCLDRGDADALERILGMLDDRWPDLRAP